MWFRVRVSHPPSQLTHWSCDHVILKKSFTSTFARIIATNFSKEWLSWVGRNHRVTWLIYHVITLYSQKGASPVSQHQWPSNLVRLWVRVKGPHLFFQVTCRSNDHVLFEECHASTTARPQNSAGDIKHRKTHKSKPFFVI